MLGVLGVGLSMHSLAVPVGHSLLQSCHQPGPSWQLPWTHQCLQQSQQHTCFWDDRYLVKVGDNISDSLQAQVWLLQTFTHTQPRANCPVQASQDHPRMHQLSSTSQHTCDAHSNTNVCSLQGGCIIDAVARHCHNLPAVHVLGLYWYCLPCICLRRLLLVAMSQPVVEGVPSAIKRRAPAGGRCKQQQKADTGTHVTTLPHQQHMLVLS